jgi:hypothetical protein
MKPGKKIKTFVMGDYQIQFGQGLVAWSGMAQGKSADVINIKRQGRGIRAYSSSGEFDFLRGIAVSMGKKRLQCDVWASYRNLDAGLAPLDTSFSDFGVSSFYVSGLHRSWNELHNKAKVQQYVAGGHVRWNLKNASVELTAQEVIFSRALYGGSNPYERYDPSGNQFASVGIAHTYLWRNFHVFGEAAIDKQQSLSIVEGCVVSIGTKLSLSMYGRRLPPAACILLNNPLRENAQPRNETGTYFGIQYQLTKDLKYSGSIDNYEFPWMRYGVSGPGGGYEFLNRLTYTIGKTSEVYLECKQQNKLADFLPDGDRLARMHYEDRGNMRFNMRMKISNSLSLQERMEYVFLNQKQEHGSLIYQEIVYKPMGRPITFTLRYVLFNSGGYDSRLYAWEQDPPGSGSTPIYYYAGQRYSCMVRYHAGREMDLWIKYSLYAYDNKSIIGSGTEAINGNRRSEIKMQMRLSF